jgi:hypothetical protein
VIDAWKLERYNAAALSQRTQISRTPGLLPLLQKGKKAPNVLKSLDAEMKLPKPPKAASGRAHGSAPPARNGHPLAKFFMRPTARENCGYFFPKSDCLLGSQFCLSGSLLRDERVVYQTAP